MISFTFFPNIFGGFVGRSSFQVLTDKYKVSQWIHLKQVHGDQILLLQKTEEISQTHLAEGDAIISTLPNTPIAVRVADCVPILIADPSGVIATVHAGWRGTRLEIVQKTLSQMKEKMNLSLREVTVVIGPSICGKCYEVGEEVAEHFFSYPNSKNEKPVLQPIGQSKFHLDLKEANRLQTLESGVQLKNIEVSPECTRCNEKEFYSYRGSSSRGEKNDGRNYGWIYIKS